MDAPDAGTDPLDTSSAPAAPAAPAVDAPAVAARTVEPASVGSAPAVEAPVVEPAFAGPAVEHPAPTGPAAAVRPTARRTFGSVQVALAVIALLAGAALFLSGYSLGSRTASTPGTPASDATLFQPFWSVWDSITRSYVGPVDRVKLVEGAIDGMVKALGDPFSAYMSPADLQSARDSIGGQFSGIGATIGTRDKDGKDVSCTPLGPDCRMAVVAPMDGSPAQKAGITPNDVITRIDGVAVDGLTLDAAIAKVRGPKDTTVTLTIVRGTTAPVDVPIVRDTILQPQVTTRDYQGGTVRYIRVSSFSDRAAADFAAAVQAGIAAGERSFIVDLRDNPGGYVTAARSIASQFIASGPIFWEEAADGTQQATTAEPGGAASGAGIRVAVLVNKGSASASEIVAGALQDTGRGFLVGEQSYGKGTIQAWMDLTDNTGGFRLTIAKWLTPNKRWIHHVGLTPDVPVAASTSGTQPTGDPYIDAALARLGQPAVVPVAPRAVAPRAPRAFGTWSVRATAA